MEQFAHNKAEGAKKVIVATKNSSNNVLRARPSKGSASPRHSKAHAAKTYSGIRNVNGNLMNLSWPNLGSQVSPGNASPEKSPLGHHRSGSLSFENSHAGMQLDSSKFLSDSNVAKFNATLFSSAASHSSRGLDVEEAMDIDHQDANDEVACASSTCSSSVSEVSEGIVSTHDQPRALEDKNLTEECPAGGRSNRHVSSTKPKVIT